MPASGVGFDLAHLLAPVNIGNFLQDDWEKRPLFIDRNDPAYYRDLFSLDSFDEVLGTCRLHSANLNVVRAGDMSSLPALLGNTPALGIERVYEQYRSGSTVILQLLHERWEALTNLCSGLSGELSTGLQVNAYLTPRNSQGFNIHYDTHDVFVLQIEGSKHWRLYEGPEDLPLPGQHYQQDRHIPSAELGEWDLYAGDALYIPRGFLHEAVATESTSLHLTLGALPITWAEVILSAVETVIEENRILRESLPPGFVDNGSICKKTENRAYEALNLLFSKISPGDLLIDATRRALSARRPDLRGHLLDLELASVVQLATPVRRRPGVQWSLGRAGDHVYLQFHGKELRMPDYVEPELNFITSATATFTGAALPGELDEKGRLTLIRRLLREGFLTQVPP